MSVIFDTSDFESPNFTVQRVNVTPGQTDPFGGSSASIIAEDATVENNHQIYKQPVLEIGETYEFLVSVKAVNRNWVSLRTLSSSTRESWFNVSAGVKGYGTHQSFDIERAGNDFYICRVEFVAGAEASFAFIRIAEANNDSSFTGLDQNSLIIYRAILRTPGGAPPFLALTRRKSKDMVVRQRIAKARNTLRGKFD